MMQQPMLNGAAPVVVFGIEVQDPALIGKIKTVCVVAALMALCNLSWGVFSLATAGGAGLITIGCALCVPACGYFGAKNKNKELLCAFWGCNGLSVCCTITMAVTLLFVGAILGVAFKAVMALGDVAKQCCPTLGVCAFAADGCTCTYTNGVTVYPQAYSGCPSPDNGTQPTDPGTITNSTITCLSQAGCSTYESMAKSGMSSLFEYSGFAAVVMLVPCALSCAACVFGYQLWSHPTFTRGDRSAAAAAAGVHRPAAVRPAGHGLAAAAVRAGAGRGAATGQVSLNGRRGGEHPDTTLLLPCSSKLGMHDAARLFELRLHGNTSSLIMGAVLSNSPHRCLAVVVLMVACRRLNM
eukprot:SAG22_NODE_607_length_8603_cov_4.554327_9_plen_354_part_00